MKTHPVVKKIFESIQGEVESHITALDVEFYLVPNNRDERFNSTNDIIVGSALNDRGLVDMDDLKSDLNSGFFSRADINESELDDFIDSQT